jgi:hypothetical protein
VYDGCAIPDLAGAYFFGDYCSGQVWGLTRTGGKVDITDYTTALNNDKSAQISNISSFGLDEAGEVYICDISDGEVFKIVPAISLQLCMTGPGNPHQLPDDCEGTAAERCSTSFDMDSNLTVDLLDFQLLQNLYMP